MRIDLNTFSTKRLMQLGIWAIPCVMFLSIGLTLLTGYEKLFSLFIPLCVLSVYFVFRYSKTKTTIDLSDNRFLKINDESIPYPQIVGYFFNEMGLLQSSLSIKLKSNRSIHIVGANYGKEGREFSAMQSKVIEHLGDKNPRLIELDYHEDEVKQPSIFRPFLFGLAGLILTVDIIIYILTFVFEPSAIPFSLLLLNLALTGLIPFINKR